MPQNHNPILLAHHLRALARTLDRAADWDEPYPPAVQLRIASALRTLQHVANTTPAQNDPDADVQ